MTAALTPGLSELRSRARSLELSLPRKVEGIACLGSLVGCLTLHGRTPVQNSLFLHTAQFRRLKNGRNRNTKFELGVKKNEQ